MTTTRVYNGLYGQPFSKYNYEWVTPDSNHDWKSVSFLDSFNGNLFGDGNVGGVPNQITLNADDDVLTTTIVYWTQSADDLTSYVKAATARYGIKEDGNYNITDRIQGMNSAGYMWTTSEAMPSQWKSTEVMDSTTDGISETGYTNVVRGSNTYLHIKYDRKKYDIVFFNGNDVVKRVGDVPFGSSLSPYENQAPVISAETIQEGYYFAGWYEDPTFQKPADWSGTMPLSNKTLYAKIAPVEYHVIVDLNGGSIPEDVHQDLSFWVPFNTVLDDTNFMAATPPDDHHSLVGFYTDEAFNSPWNFDTRLTNASMTIVYDGPDDPTRELYHDDGWDTTVGVIKLYARWRDDSIAALGGLTIQYLSGSTVVYTDPVKYGDLATVIAGAAPASDYWPEDKKFDHWELGGKTFYPTEEFEADSAKAVDMTIDGSPAKVIKVNAVYVDAEPKTDSHIYWYSNVIDSNGNSMDLNSFKHQGITESAPGKGWVKKELNVQINKGYDIPSATLYSIPGYEFLGWARVESDDAPAADAGSAGDSTLASSGPGTLGEDDLFLKWDGTKYQAKDKNGEWADVTQVAADEETPYHDLYAVWQRAKFFYVFHTGSGKLEAIPMTAVDSEDGFDLTALVDENSLYGGYYKAYGGVNETKLTEAINAFVASPAADKWKTNNVTYPTYQVDDVAHGGTFEAYNGTSAKATSGSAFFPKIQAYKASAGDAAGTNVKPANDGQIHIYYLKEVPNTYLRSRIQYVYDTNLNNKITQIWVMTALDSSGYSSRDISVSLNGGASSKTYALSLTYEFVHTWAQKDGTETGHKSTTVEAFGLSGGMVGFAEADASIIGDSVTSFTMTPSWTTLDGVTVINEQYGARTFTFNVDHNGFEPNP